LDCIIDGKEGLSIVNLYNRHSENCITIVNILQDLSKKFQTYNFFWISPGWESLLVLKKFLVNRLPIVLAMRNRYRTEVHNQIDHFGEMITEFQEGDPSCLLL
jgi:hypothetical protein